MDSILVACVGNVFLGDDGFGVEVAQHLKRREAPAGVRIEDFGIRGFDLAYALMDPWQHVVLVDAMDLGCAPGDVSVVQPDLESVEAPEHESLDSHGMHPICVLHMVKQMGGTPPPLTLLACQPLDCGGEEGRMGLSPVVEAAVPTAIEVLDRLLEELSGRRGRTN